MCVCDFRVKPFLCKHAQLVGDDEHDGNDNDDDKNDDDAGDDDGDEDDDDAGAPRAAAPTWKPTVRHPLDTMSNLNNKQGNKKIDLCVSHTSHKEALN